MQQRVEFNLKVEDYQAFWQHVMTRHAQSKQGKWENITCWFIGIVIILGSMILLSEAESLTEIIAPLVVIASTAWLFIWMAWKRRTHARRSVKKMLKSPSGKHMLETQTIVITPERLQQSGSFGEISLSWSTFTEIQAVEGATYFYLEADSAIILPMHAFSNEQEYLEFTQKAQQYYDPSESPKHSCKKCGYDLRGVAEYGCPECGWQREK